MLKRRSDSSLEFTWRCVVAPSTRKAVKPTEAQKPRITRPSIVFECIHTFLALAYAHCNQANTLLVQGNACTVQAFSYATLAELSATKSERVTARALAEPEFSRRLQMVSYRQQVLRACSKANKTTT